MAKKEKRFARNTRKPKAGRRIFFLLDIIIRLVPFLFIILISALIVKGIWHILIHSDYFNIKYIEVMDRSSAKLETSMARDLYSNKGINIFLLDIKRCEYDIERDYPEIRDAVVYRRLPDMLFVSYRLRKPVCQIESGSYYLVSDDAVIIPPPLLSKQPALTVVSGINVNPKLLSGGRHEYRQQLVHAIGIIKDINDIAKDSCLPDDFKVKEVNVYDIDNPALILEDGTRIELGAYRVKDKLDTIKKVLNDLLSRRRKAKVIDLRFEDVVVVPC